MRRALLALTAFLLSATMAYGDPILAGSLAGNTRGLSVSLQNDDFFFQGFVTPFTGAFAPLSWDGAAGSALDLTARWIGCDLPGFANYLGESFSDVGSLTATTTMNAEWVGNVFVPEDFLGGELTAPFIFSGLFVFLGGAVDFAGTGVATVGLSRREDGQLNVATLRYDFADTPPELTPEPASLLLVASGLGAVLYRRRINRGANCL